MRWVHGIGYLERNADGSLSRMFGTIQDITDRKQLEERLFQSEKMQAGPCQCNAQGVGQLCCTALDLELPARGR